MSQVAPVITAIDFDQASYPPGAEIRATIHYIPGASEQVVNFSGTATDASTGQTGQMSGTFTVLANDATTLAVSDTSNRTWTKVSDDGSVAVYTATA